MPQRGNFPLRCSNCRYSRDCFCILVFFLIGAYDIYTRIYATLDSSVSRRGVDGAGLELVEFLSSEADIHLKSGTLCS